MHRLVVHAEVPREEVGPWGVQPAPQKRNEGSARLLVSLVAVPIF